MKYQDFIENIKDYVSSKLPSGQKVMLQSVTKNNGLIYDGLFIVDPVLNVSPTIYLNPYYHRYLSGVPMDDIYEDVLSTYYSNLPTHDFDASIFTDFTRARERIVMKLVNYKRNEQLLQSIPYIPFMDLAIIFVCSVTDFLNEYATILVHNEHLNLWNISKDELYKIAMENSPRLLPHHFESIKAFLPSETESYIPWFDKIEMYILTNSIKIHGATCLTYPGVLNNIADELNSDLIIIPSSIHETIIIPRSYLDSQEKDFPNFEDMIREVNDTQLTDDEVLGDRVYYYQRDTGTMLY